MAKNDNLEDFLKDIADGIRSVTHGTDEISAQNFSTEIKKLKNPQGNIELQVQSGTDVINYATATVKQGSASINTSTITPSFSKSGNVITVTGSTDSTALVTSGWISSVTKGTSSIASTGNTYTIQTQEKTASASGNVEPDSGKYLTKVIIPAGSASVGSGTITPSITKSGNVITVTGSTTMNGSASSGWISGITPGSASIASTGNTYTIKVGNPTAVTPGASELTISPTSGNDYMTSVTVKAADFSRGAAYTSTLSLSAGVLYYTNATISVTSKYATKATYGYTWNDGTSFTIPANTLFKINTKNEQLSVSSFTSSYSVSGSYIYTSGSSAGSNFSASRSSTYGFYTTWTTTGTVWRIDKGF